MEVIEKRLKSETGVGFALAPFCYGAHIDGLGSASVVPIGFDGENFLSFDGMRFSLHPVKGCGRSPFPLCV